MAPPEPPAQPSAPPRVAETPAPEPPGTGSDPAFEALWNRVLERWDDDKTHGAFLEHTVRTQQLAEAAARYRALRDDLAKGERARKRLEAVATTAVHLMMATKTAPQRRGNRLITLVAFVLCVAAMIGLAMMALRG